MRRTAFPLVVFSALLASGCGLTGGAIDVAAVVRARAGLEDSRRRLPLEDDEKPEPESRETGSVIVGELLAIFPGMLVHGLGHYYAGDYRTSAQLFRIGELGYALTAVGGGLGVGGYYLDHDTSIPKGYPYTLYATGGVVGVVGVSYFLTAWIYDMIDTPRAVQTGGEPPPRSPFVEALDVFE